MNSSERNLIFVVRHGETDLNAKGAFRGKSNVPLNAKGLEQAHEVAEKLVTLASHAPFAEAIASDRKRATETAEIVCEALDMPYDVTSKLRAWDVGTFSGKPKNAENRKLLQQFIDHPDRPIPMGESLNAFKARVRPVIRESLRTASLAGQPVLIIAHSSIVHEVGSMFHGDDGAVLVEPGGIALVFRGPDNKVSARALFRAKQPTPDRADTIS